jgi:hypothetical protein
MRILLPSEQTIELYTEMELSGTETGSLNPEAWPRNIRGAWIFAGGYRAGPDFPAITRTEDQLGKGIFYLTPELNDRFTTVFT